MLKKVIIVLCALNLVGCAYNGILWDTAATNCQTNIPTQQPTSPTTTEYIVPTSEQTETQLSATQPTYCETVPSLQIVQPEPRDEDFVLVKNYIPDIVVDLRYATDNNFTNQKIYDFSDAWLRYGTVKKLASVQKELKEFGLYLKIWDGFRPPSAQYKLWNACPDPTYVSDPNMGFSSHSRGNTVDITLVYADGTELRMPTLFDDFSGLADRDYSDCDSEAAQNAIFLEELMKKHGFKPYAGEWWHFTDNQQYLVDASFEPVEPILCYADCNEYISLRTAPSTKAEAITSIATGEQFCVIAYYDNFVLIEYKQLLGYVPLEYIQTID